MKKLISIVTGTFLFVAFIIIISSCAATKEIADKSSTQLWGENCMRCHNTPPSSAYNNTQWETISMHMKLRANLTDLESEKILEFLKSSN